MIKYQATCEVLSIGLVNVFQYRGTLRSAWQDQETGLDSITFLSYGKTRTSWLSLENAAKKGPVWNLVEKLRHILLAMGVGVELVGSVQRRPFWLVLEQAHRLDVLFSKQISLGPFSPFPNFTTRESRKRKKEKTHIILIRRKPMINPRWENNQIILPIISISTSTASPPSPPPPRRITYLIQLNPNPLFPFAPYVKVARPVAHVPDLLVLVQVLVEEGSHLGFVDVAHGCGGHGDFVAVAVAALRGERVDGRERGHAEVEDAEGREVGGGQGVPGVVGEALVALGGVREVNG